MPWPSCPSGTYRSVAPCTVSSGRCDKVTQCTSGQYQVKAPTSTSDRVCKSLRVCGTLEYQLKAPTKTSDRVCKGLRVCAPHEYESKAPTSTTDRECSSVAACPAGQERVATTAKGGIYIQVKGSNYYSNALPIGVVSGSITRCNNECADWKSKCDKICIPTPSCKMDGWALKCTTKNVCGTNWLSKFCALDCVSYGYDFDSGKCKLYGTRPSLVWTSDTSLKFYERTKCAPCKPGTFKSAAGDFTTKCQTCEACPAGFKRVGCGQDSAGKCVACAKEPSSALSAHTRQRASQSSPAAQDMFVSASQRLRVDNAQPTRLLHVQVNGGLRD